MIEPSQLMQLPKGQVFALFGGRLWKARLPLPIKPRNKSIPDGVEAIAEAMRRHYVTNDLWFRSEEPWWRRAAAIASAHIPSDKTSENDGDHNVTEASPLKKAAARGLTGAVKSAAEG